MQANTEEPNTQPAQCNSRIEIDAVNVDENIVITSNITFSIAERLVVG